MIWDEIFWNLEKKRDCQKWVDMWNLSVIHSDSNVKVLRRRGPILCNFPSRNMFWGSFLKLDSLAGCCQERQGEWEMGRVWGRDGGWDEKPAHLLLIIYYSSPQRFLKSHSERKTKPHSLNVCCVNLHVPNEAWTSVGVAACVSNHNFQNFLLIVQMKWYPTQTSLSQTKNKKNQHLP